MKKLFTLIFSALATLSAQNALAYSGDANQSVGLSAKATDSNEKVNGALVAFPDEEKAPVFTKSLSNRTFACGSPCIMLVNTDSYSDVTYQWYINGEAVEGVTSNNYPVYSEEPKTVKCYVKATNSAGTTTSEEVTITFVHNIIVSNNSYTVSSSDKYASAMSIFSPDMSLNLSSKYDYSVADAGVNAPEGYPYILKSKLNPNGIALYASSLYNISTNKNGTVTLKCNIPAGNTISIMKNSYSHVQPAIPIDDIIPLMPKAKAAGAAESAQEIGISPKMPPMMEIPFFIGDNKVNGSTTLDENFIGDLSFDADENEEYYIYVEGNNFGIYGYEFDTSLSTSAPVFESVPVSKNIVKGYYTVLTAYVKGNLETTYQWYNNGEPIDGATYEYYELYPENVGDVFNIYVEATNENGTARSYPAQLTVIDDTYQLEEDKYVVSGTDKVAEDMRFAAPNVEVYLNSCSNYTVNKASDDAPEGFSYIINGKEKTSLYDYDYEYEYLSYNYVVGTGYNVYAKKDGKFTITCNVEPGKAIYVKKQNDNLKAKAAGAAESAQASGLAQELSDIAFYIGENIATCGTKLDEAYNGTISFYAYEGEKYIVYAKDSDIGMYGFEFDTNVKKSAPVFTSSPESKTVFANNEEEDMMMESLTASVQGYPKPTYQWYVDGVTAEYETSDRFMPRFTEPGEHEVYVVATNSEGTATSEKATITVIDRDYMLSENKYVVSGTDKLLGGMRFVAPNINVSLNNMFDFNVDAADASAPEGYPYIMNGNYSNKAINGMYKIMVNPYGETSKNSFNVYANANGKFTIKCKIPAGKTVSVKYRILSAPKIYIEQPIIVGPKAKAAGAAESAQEIDISPKMPPMMEIPFFIGDNEVLSSITLDETFNGELSFDVNADEGYYITIGDNFGMYGFEFDADTETSVPVFESVPVSKNIVKGDFTVLTAKVKGNLETTYQWYKDDKPIEGATSNYYEIIPQNTGDVFNIYVEATNENGTARSYPAQLTVIDDTYQLEEDKYVASGTDKIADNLTFVAPKVSVSLMGGNFNINKATFAPEGFSHLINGTVNAYLSDNNFANGTVYRITANNDSRFILNCCIAPNRPIFVKRIIRNTHPIGAKAVADKAQAKATQTLEDVPFSIGDNEVSCGTTVENIYNGTLSFNVNGSDSYYIYSEGSNIGMYGFELTEATGINDITADKANAATPVKYVKDGNIVIVKDGKLYNAAGAQMK